jgi:hypothetical protein
LHSSRTGGLMVRRKDGGGFRFRFDRDFVGHNGSQLVLFFNRFPRLLKNELPEVPWVRENIVRSAMIAIFISKI